jgi:hypothetical protein
LRKRIIAEVTEAPMRALPSHYKYKWVSKKVRFGTWQYFKWIEGFTT